MTTRLDEEALTYFESSVSAFEGRMQYRYNGRGMSGHCIAFVVDSLRQVTQVLVDLADMEPDLAVGLSADLMLDQLGRGYIAYFPHFKYDPEEDPSTA